ENLAPNARAREFLYQHDVGLARLRRLMKKEAEKQLKKIAALNASNRIEMQEEAHG
ncbi:3-phenylpropionate dioxygenase, partial [Acinetobacter baumannii]